VSTQESENHTERDPHQATPAGKPRARALGLTFRGTPGKHNAITDVPSLELGYQTLIQGDNVRTGVTAIHPRGKHNPGDPLAAGYHSQNGNGEMTGISWIEESGTMQGPIAITNTHAVGIAHAGIIAWMNQYHRELGDDVWLLPVAAETWDGYLNDINGHHVNEDDVIQALQKASTQQPDEGSVGGGTGMNCYQYKGGSGTASRLVDYAGTTYTVGVFVQANFGRRHELTLNGIYLGEELKDDNPLQDHSSVPPGAGSVIAVVATNAPFFPSQCKALARRVTAGLARTGTAGSHSSGDIFLAFSTANQGGITGSDALPPGDNTRYDRLTFIPWGRIDPLFEAVVQATEEAVANALIANDDMTGRDGHRSPALPKARLSEIIARYSR
jgi:D-aminopeptidase